MKIEINKLVPDKIDLGFLEKFAKRILNQVKLNIPELSIVIVNDARMKSINKKYRHKNKTTDVLSFEYGEIILCLNQAKRQAKKEKHLLKEELEILLLHGILHLAGYDDQTNDGYEKMVNKQNQVLRKIISSPR
ncbi:MAG: rRNA maturation RNase YbeY [Candidatus Portnoybacteria bacterium]|nr:rRNA maturation RNase YbeY [Candidatus Portnoybacteria bacterium]